jgi:hydroxymethylglutaryl-CoA synthase
MIKTKRNSFGIIGAEFYFPKNYVDQKELEKVSLVLIKFFGKIFIFKFYRADAGKYTIGFGQIEMSFCYENEDVCSMALSATSKLLKNYQVFA